MLLKRLTCIAVWILIPDFVFLQSVSEKNIHDEHVPCENGWYNFKEKCFKVGGAREKVDWYKAVEHCRTLGADLATIESIEENDFLIGLLLLEIQGSAWIGLNDQAKESVYLWQSGSQSDFRNWRPSEPSGHKIQHEDCVQLIVELSEDLVGQWNDNDCKVSLGYICEKKSSLENSSPNLKKCSPADGGGFRFQKFCYHLVNDLKSWNDAEQYCIDKYGGHLMTILDKTTDYYLKYVFQGNNAELWTGIKIQNKYQQQFVSGWYVGYNGFKEEEPDFVDGTCVVRKNRKEWDIVSCSTRYAFICEISRVKPPVLKPSPKDAFCPSTPSGWRDLGGEFCYYIETSKPATWYEANFNCIRRDGQLVSFHSKEESDILSPLIQLSGRGAFIGLIRHYRSTFKWIDGSEMDFSNWSPGEPNSGNEICVEALLANMKWNDIDCRYTRSYICSVRKIIPNTPIPTIDSVPTTTTTAQPSQDPFEGSLSPNTTIPLTDSVTTTTTTAQPSEDPFVDSLSPNTTIPFTDSVTTTTTTAQPSQENFVDSTTPTTTTTVKSDNKVKVSGHQSRNIIIALVICLIVFIIIVIIAIFKFRLCNKKSMDTQLHYKDMISNEQDC